MRSIYEEKCHFGKNDDGGHIQHALLLSDRLANID